MPDILFETNKGLAKITLNRPQALNALNAEIFVGLEKQLKRWAKDASIKAVLVRSTIEKAFCAGGDIRAIYDHKSLSPDIMTRYFRLEYDTNRLIAHYPKPYIALLNGITMGGGVGISAHGAYRIAAENLRWAMPETAIGFFPDVGASYYLARLPHHIGIYLALTGETINAADALHLKLIDAIVSSNCFDAIEKKLIEVAADPQSIKKIINEFQITATNKLSLPTEIINTCFAFDTVEAILDALEKQNTDWTRTVIVQLQKRSPTSLKVTLQQLYYAKQKSVDDVVEMDFHITKNMLKKHDFYEGIRAAIVDKDKNPQWRPATLGAVSDRDVDAYFLE